MGRSETKYPAPKDQIKETHQLPPYALEAAASPSLQHSRVSNGESTNRLSDTIDRDGQTPAYTSSMRTIIKPIAVPQISANPTAPFVAAYATSLLQYGITLETWTSLIGDLATLLNLQGTGLATRHAAGMAKSLVDAPAEYGKGVASHAKSLGQNIGECAKHGNILGAAVGTLGGGTSLILHSVFGAVGTLIRAPGSPVAAIMQKPKTARQHADAYLDTVNKHLFAPRGLQAHLLDTEQLASLLGLSGTQILQDASCSKGKDAETQLRMLRPYLSELEVHKTGPLTLDQRTLWLVIDVRQVNG